MRLHHGIEPIAVELFAADKQSLTLSAAERMAAISHAISAKRQADALARIADAISGPGSVGGGAPSATAYQLLDTIADAVSGGGGALDKLVAALDPENPEGFLRAGINSYGEGIGDAIQGQLVRGQRGIDQYEGR